MNEKQLGKLVIARTVSGEFQGIGRVIGYHSAPTFTIERSDGTRFHWRADICVVAGPDCLRCTGEGNG